MTDHFLSRAKGYVALVGSVATALLALYGPDTQMGHVLTIVLALATAFGTYQVPNRLTYHEGNAKPDHRGAVDVLLLVGIATLVVVLLLFFGVRGH